MCGCRAVGGWSTHKEPDGTAWSVRGQTDDLANRQRAVHSGWPRFRRDSDGELEWAVLGMANSLSRKVKRSQRQARGVSERFQRLAVLCQPDCTAWAPYSRCHCSLSLLIVVPSTYAAVICQRLAERCQPERTARASLYLGVPITHRPYRSSLLSIFALQRDLLGRARTSFALGYA